MSGAIAQDDDVVVVKEASGNVVVEDSSAFHRIKKLYEIVVMPAGYGPLAGTNTGISLGYFLDRNSLIEARYTNLDRGSTCSGSLTCNSSGHAVGVAYKRFFGNSFYISASLDQRESSYRESDDSFTPPYTYSFDGSSTLLGLVIGNQWQWQNFTLGCDWIGAGKPVATKISNEKVSGSGSSFAQQNLIDAENYQVKNTIPYVLRFYLGASF